MDIAARLEVLERENEMLRARIAQLEEALFATDSFVAPAAWGLSRLEAQVFGVLLARPLARKDTIMQALYAGRAGDPPEDNICDLWICKLRRKLRPFGIEIKTAWGQGWMLEPETRAALRPTTQEKAA